MPIPIQIGSLTDRLRRFLRIRGRVKLQLDEIVVPTVQVQDLTVGPYLAGVEPCAGNFAIAIPAAAPSQFVIYLNPDAAIPPVADLTTDVRFIGRSFTMESLMLSQRGSVNYRWRIGLVPRGLMLGATLGTTKQLLSVQDGAGILNPVPVVIGAIIAVPFVLFAAPNEFFSATQVGVPEIPIEMPSRPGTTITTEQVIVCEQVNAGAGTMDLSIRGTYQSQPS